MAQLSQNMRQLDAADSFDGRAVLYARLGRLVHSLRRRSALGAWSPRTLVKVWSRDTYGHAVESTPAGRALHAESI
jgi:hypothetical protein